MFDIWSVLFSYVGLSAMETICAMLACCLLGVFFAEAQTEKAELTPATPILNLAYTTPSNATTTVSNMTVHTTPFNSTSWENETSTETTGHPQTAQSTTIMTPLTTTTSPTHSSSFTAATLTVTAIQTTAGYISTPDTPAITTANLSNTVNTTLDSVDIITQGKYQETCFHLNSMNN